MATSQIGRRRAAAAAEGSELYLHRRKEILAAAAQVFKRKGYRGTALSDVAGEIDIDRATLYYYVKSKEDLFADVVGAAVEENTLAAERIRDSDSSAPQ